MRDGADRVKVEYVWPQTLLLPSRPPKLVYLDLNHWIELSKAFVGHPDGERYKDSLAAILSAVEQRKAVFPISDSIYFEISKISSHRQRCDLREVIEKVSGYTVIISRADISSHEIEAVLDQLYGENPRPINLMSYLGLGADYAFGIVRRLVLKNEKGEDVTVEARSRFPGGPDAFDRFDANTDIELNRKYLEGPAPEEEGRLRDLGWNPESTIQITERRAQQEIEQVGRFDSDPRWRRGRIRDVIRAWETLVELRDKLMRGLIDRGIDPGDFSLEREEARRVFDSMPSFDVAVTMKTAYHRNPRHNWTANDVADIDALGSSLPYCDIVVTDSAVASQVRQYKLAERLNTTVLARLADLSDLLK